MLDIIEAILSSTLDFAPSIVLAALGGVISERSGVVNLGLEGMMRLGAFFAAATALATGNPWLGLCAAMLAGGLSALLHGYLAIRWRSDQIISGIALNLVALGGVTFLVESWYGRPDTEPSAAIGKLSLPGLDAIPLLRALDGHSHLCYLALFLAFLLHFVLYHTALGLRVRAVGEKPQAAATLGVQVHAIRYGCVLASGVLAGMGEPRSPSPP